MIVGYRHKRYILGGSTLECQPAIVGTAAKGVDEESSKDLMKPWQIGNVSIERVVEVQTTGGTRFLLPDATRDAVLPIDWLRPEFADDDGNLVRSSMTRCDRLSTLDWPTYLNWTSS